MTLTLLNIPHFDHPNLGYIKDIYKNTKLKKIVNVYQKNYINTKGQGFGDFLRGSIYLTYVCMVLGLEFDIDIKNHPMSMYLNDDTSLYKIDYSNIEAYIDKKFKEKPYILNFINNLNHYGDENLYIFNNSIALFDIENPNFNIIQKARNIIIPKIEPKQFILDMLDNKLNTCNLKRNQYAVIHIRAGDYFMNIQKNVDTHKHQISEKHINAMISIISRSFSKEKKYILVGDSDEIKKIIASKFNNIIIFDTQITHLGEDDKINDNALIETMIDFNIMRFSNCIISFTAYAHGSGFSKYCATLYNVPFNQIFLKPLLKYKS
jgi:hypothetical protein